MKNLFTYIIIAALCSCAANNATVKSAPVNDAAFSLKVHETKTISGSGDMYIRFDSVLSDSRCPKNVQCVWQGVATAQLLIGNKTEQQSFNLSTAAVQKYIKDTIVMGYRIEVANLLPYPDKDIPFTNQDYIISLKIRKQ